MTRPFPKTTLPQTSQARFSKTTQKTFLNANKTSSTPFDPNFLRLLVKCAHVSLNLLLGSESKKKKKEFSQQKCRTETQMHKVEIRFTKN